MSDLVVGVDESAGAAAALRWAVREAEVRGWTVRAVLAWGPLAEHHRLPDEWFDPDDVEADALAVLDAAVERAVGAEAARSVERQAVHGPAAPALIAASTGAQLLVVGARGLGGFHRLLLGSVTAQCMHHATCSVAVVHRVRAGEGTPSPEESRPRIVVGVDGSEHGQRALRWALEEARARGTTVEVVHAWSPPLVDRGDSYSPLLADDPMALAPVAVEAFEEVARHVLDEAVEAAAASGLASPVEQALVCGDPAPALLDAAKDAALLVVGSRGVGGFRGLLLGSVSQQVVHHARCPVVVVRAPHSDARPEDGGPTSP